MDKNSFKEYCIISKYSLSTMKQYLLYEKKFLKIANYKNDINQDVANEFLKESQYSKTAIAFLKVYLDYLKNYYFDSENSTNININIPKQRGRNPKKKMIYLTKNEVYELVDKTQDFQVKLMILMLFETGMRITELIKLRWKYINFENNLIKVIHGKGKKERIVMISELTKHALKNYMDSDYFKGFDSEIFYFSNLEIHKDRSLDLIDIYRNRVKYFDKLLKKYSELHINKPITAHSLRHSCASYLRNDCGMELDDVAIYMGHSSLESTKIYSHRKEEKVLEKIRKSIN